MDITMTDAEYAEAIDLAIASLSQGGERTFLAKALLRARATVLVERKAWQQATGCVNPETIAGALGNIGALAERKSTEGIPDAIERIKRQRDKATIAERERCAAVAEDSGEHIGLGSAHFDCRASIAAAIRCGEG